MNHLEVVKKLDGQWILPEGFIFAKSRFNPRYVRGYVSISREDARELCAHGANLRWPRGQVGYDSFMIPEALLGRAIYKAGSPACEGEFRLIPFEMWSK